MSLNENNDDKIKSVEYFKKKRYYDVAVIGGGFAGISAALSAARLGSRVILAESSYILGGLATSGLVTVYLPLCDGKGHQLSFGIAEELMKLSISHGAECDYPEAWLNDKSENMAQRTKTRYTARFNPHVFAVLCEQLLLKSGVEILYGATMNGIKKNETANAVVSCSLVTKTDAYEVFARSFVDCTGDASLFYLFGSELSYPLHKNARAAWYYELFEGEYRLKTLGNCSYIYSDDYETGISGVDGEENSREVIASHSVMLDNFLQNGEVSMTHAIATVPTIPQLRMTRMINGAYRIKKTDDKKYFESSVGAFGSWLERGLAFELPLESLYCTSVKNLCAAGRCISVSGDDMWDITRVIPVCAVSGEAAGILASVSSDFPNASARDVQSILDERNVKYHIKDLIE